MVPYELFEYYPWMSYHRWIIYRKLKYILIYISIAYYTPYYTCSF